MRLNHTLIRYIVIALLAMLAVLSATAFLNPPRNNEAAYSLSTIEVARTPEAREQGLSGRLSVPPEYGLLFVFPTAGKYGFWMKDMRVSIDIIWLSDDGTIIGIEESVAPETYPDVFYPPAPVRYVLEVAAGEAKTHGWSIGTKLELPL